MSSPRKVSIGYALSPKKEASFLQEELRSRVRSLGIEFVPIDTGVPLDEQGPFHVILHKILGAEWCGQLEEFGKQHPEVIIVDPPESIKRLHNRLSMLQAVSGSREYACGCTVGVPAQMPVFERDRFREVRDRFASTGLKFPVIAKPLVADGTAISHLMWLVRSWKGLERLPPPFVLQQFVNHGGVIFKVYVVGDHVKCVRRPSLPDVDELELENECELESFSHVSNASRGKSTAMIIDTSKLESTELPSAELQEAVSSRLRQSLGLRLFNFDLIRDRTSRHFYIVDINYFPGFAKMPDFVNTLADFFVGLSHETSPGFREGKPNPQQTVLPVAAVI